MNTLEMYNDPYYFKSGHFTHIITKRLVVNGFVVKQPRKKKMKQVFQDWNERGL